MSDSLLDASSPIRLENRVPILTVTLNRPAKANALNQEMLDTLDGLFRDLAKDEEIKVVVFKGEGRGFCGGYDLDSLERKSADGRRDPLVEYRRYDDQVRRWLTLWELPKVTIAQVHGYCLGGAMQLAFLCDLTYVSDDVRIQYPAIRAGGGLIPPTWVHAIGPKRTKALAFTAGACIDGKTAAEWGWANASFPVEELDERVDQVAREIAVEPLGLLQIEKAAINRAVDMGGYRSMLLTGALGNAVGHGSWASAEIHQRLEAQGVKNFANERLAAIEALRRG
jgi:enoyl-CoA hydratase